MGHGTASDRTSQSARPQRSIAEALGTTNEELTRRSQQIIQGLKPTSRMGDIRDFTVVNAETNRRYGGAIWKNLEEPGYTVNLFVLFEGGQRNNVINGHRFNNITQARNAIYDATGIPKPSKRR